jgi:uncharacterized protein (DUF1800 family)
LLINKLTYGSTPGLTAAVEAQGPLNWLEAQLNPAALRDAEGRLLTYRTLNASNAANGFTHSFGDRICEEELTHATVIRALYSDRQLYEVMCEFWSDHFTVFLDSKYYRWWKNAHVRTVARTHALGRFEDMLLASAHSPAMLHYLDNFASNANVTGGVNQNYARELLELHTLGIVNGEQVYNEKDVDQVAKLMAGWSFDAGAWYSTQEFVFNPGAHSRSSLSILGGQWTRPPRPDGNGYGDGVAFLRFLAKHRSTARFLSWKLARRFVCDQPSEALVSRLADTYLANDTAIVPVLRALFTSDEFAGSLHAKVKRPFHHLMGVLRAVDAQVNPSPFDDAAKCIRAELEACDQRLYGRPSPDGYTDNNVNWTTTDALLRRWGTAGDITRNNFAPANIFGQQINVDLNRLCPTGVSGTVVDLLRLLARRLANYELSVADATTIATGIPAAPDATATTVWSNPALAAQAVGLILCHPTFQLR